MKNVTIAKLALRNLIPNPDQKPNRHSDAGMAKLMKSVEQHGIMIPLIVRRTKNNSKFVVIDGNARLLAAMELGWKPYTAIPCVVATMDDNEALVTGMVVNQTRERLSRLIELHTVRELVKNGLDQKEAGEQLGKSRTWCSRMLSIDQLPARVRKRIDKGEIAVSHGIALVPYASDSELLAFLVEQSASGNVSVSNIKRMAEEAAESGMAGAKRRRPHTVNFTRKSRGRVEPLINGNRIELHLNGEDDPELLAKRIHALVLKVCKQ